MTKPILNKVGTQNLGVSFQIKYRLNNSFPCFMKFKARGAAEGFKVHKTWKTSV
jgi:hypothetical protein